MTAAQKSAGRYVYACLHAHVGHTDAQLQTRLDQWAGQPHGGLKGGTDAIPDWLREAVRAEHADARNLYSDVVSGNL